jgi:hypothetical protein
MTPVRVFAEYRSDAGVLGTPKTRIEFLKRSR